MAVYSNDSIGGFGGGLGIGGGDSGVGLIALLALLGRGRGGLGGDGDDCCGEGKFLDAAVLNAVNGLTASVPTTALETQNAINSAIATLALGTQQGFANVKDSVQAAAAVGLAATNTVERTTLTTSAAILAAVADAKYASAIAVRDDGDKTRAKIDFYHDQDMQRKLTVAESALLEERTRGRIRESEVTITNTNTNTATAVSQQQQGQTQLQLLAALVSEVRNLAGDVQVVRQAQSNINFGTQTGTAQTAGATNNKVS